MKAFFTRVCMIQLLLLTLIWPLSLQAEVVQAPHIQVELISENTTFQPGQSFWVALRMNPEEHWHHYWKNPGDSGLTTRIEWNLPAGFESSEIHWPTPIQFETAGIVNFGYGKETLLLTEIQAPGDWPAAKNAEIQAKARWLVCEEICIPGKADLSLTLPSSVSSPTPDPTWAKAFADTRNALPKPLAGEHRFEIAAGKIELLVRHQGKIIPSNSGLQFFPEQSEVLTYNQLPTINIGEVDLYLQTNLNQYFNKAPEVLSGVLVVHAGNQTQAFQLSAQPGKVEPMQMAAITPISTPGAGSLIGFLGLILLAFAGGVILNLMPCVFPVLSLKAMHLVENRGQDRGSQRMHGWMYSLGVVLSFVVVALLLLSLREGGQAIGWGFQLQSPLIVALLAYLMFIMALSFMGWLELNVSFLGGRLLSKQSHGYGGSFMTGVLASVVASPCTAPFMGTALGVAVTLPTLPALLVFVALGVGMASPFLLLALFPALGRWLPRPGAWMETLRQVLAFPLLLTAIWLVWVLGRQAGVEAVAMLLVGMVLIAMAVWMLHRFRHTQSWFAKARVALALALLLLSLALTAHSNFDPLQNKIQTASAEWQPYSPEVLQQLRDEGKPVFINMTADWCLSCLVNENVVLSTEAIRQTMKSKNITYLKGDWTNSDPLITQYLEAFGRNGVPLYVYYPPHGNPVVLPQILTVSGTLEVLNGT